MMKRPQMSTRGLGVALGAREGKAYIRLTSPASKGEDEEKRQPQR